MVMTALGRIAATTEIIFYILLLGLETTSLDCKFNATVLSRIWSDNNQSINQGFL